MRRKLAMVTIGGLVLVIVAGTWWHFAWARRLAQTQRRNTGRLLADQAVLVRHWENLERSSVGGEDADNDALLVIRDLTERLNSQDYDCRFLFPADSPLAQPSERPRGEFENELLDRFAQTRPHPSGDGDWADRLTPGGNGYVYYQAVRARASCLSLCHRPPDPTLDGTAKSGFEKPLREGDLMAVVQVSMPKSGLKRR